MSRFDPRRATIPLRIAARSLAFESRRHTDVLLALFLLIAQPLLFFWKALINPRAHIPFDIVGFHLPLASYIARCVRQGVAPFWDPYPYCGMPIHADLQAQLFYPPTWVSLLLGNASDGRKLLYWLEWQVPLHMILAGLFAFALLRHLRLRTPAALLGASVYQLGGFFASQAQHLGAICAAAWLPLALLAVFKLKQAVTGRWIALLALSLALAVLAGFSAATMVVAGAVLLTLLALVATRQAGWRTVVAAGCGFALAPVLAAVQVIPTYKLANLSIASMRSEWHLRGGGLDVESLASLVWPNYYGIFTPFEPAYKLPHINFTFLYVYCGLITVALILLAPFLKKALHARVFFGLTVLAAIWMLGDATPVYRTVYALLPRIVRSAIYAEYALMAFCMFAGITAAIALERSFRKPWLLWGIALLTSADLIYTGSGRPMNSMPGSYKEKSSEYNIDGAPGALPFLQSAVNHAVPPVRIDYLDTYFYQGVWGSQMLRLPTADGDNPFMLKRMLSLRRLFCGGNPWERQLPVNRVDSPLLDMLNVGVLAGIEPIPEEEVRRAGLEPIARIAGLNLYRNPAALPRFFLAPKVYISSGEAETFKRLAGPGFNPAEEAVIEGVSPETLRGALSTGAVKVRSYTANRVELELQTSGRGFLASSEPLYPGWTAEINGKPAEFVLTNAVFRGLAIPPGQSRVVMTYKPVGLAASAAVSVLGLLFAIAGLFHSPRPPRILVRDSARAEFEAVR